MEKRSINQWAAIVVAVVVIGFFFVFGGTIESFFTDTLGTSKDLSPDTSMNENAKSQVSVEDMVVGSGDAAENGDLLTVDYSGFLSDGTKFDSSIDRGQPFQFTLGAGQVIAGWEQGLAGMKVGGKRRLSIPPELGYGENGIGPIPPNSTLIFEVDLISVQKN